MAGERSDIDALGVAAWRAVSRSQVVLELGLDRRIRWANDAAAKAFGYTRRELAGMSHANLCRPFAHAPVDNEAFWARLLSGRFARGEYKRFGKRGREVWLQATYNPVLGEAGEVRSILKLATDVTERRRNEADMLGRVEAIGRSQFVIELAPDGTVLKVNARLADALGYEPAAMVGRPHRAFFARGEGAADAHPDDPHRTIAYQAKDGNVLLVQATTSPILDASEKPVRALVIGVDVTERGALRSALDRAESAARLRQDLLAGMNRDVWTPMAGVLGFAEQLLHGDLDDHQRDQAQMILESGRTMLRMLGDLLDFSRIERGRLEIAAEAVDVGAKVRACAEQMRDAAERKGLTLRCDIAPELPRRMACDAIRLRQIVLNLLGNAIEFTQAGTVAIAAERAWDDPLVVAISVSDTGIGMSSADRAQPPAKFGPSANVPRRGAGSAGLGLTVSSELARLMGGSLTVASDPGRGTRAELRLPLVECDTGNLDPVPGPALSASVSAHRTDAPRVIVAGGSEVDRARVIGHIARIGGRAQGAADGVGAAAAIAAANAAGDPFRLVLLELSAAAPEGLADIPALRGDGRPSAEIPIVVITGDADPDGSAALAAGAQGWIARPAGPAELAHALDRWAPRPDGGGADRPARRATDHEGSMLFAAFR